MLRKIVGGEGGSSFAEVVWQGVKTVIDPILTQAASNPQYSGHVAVINALINSCGVIGGNGPAIVAACDALKAFAVSKGLDDEDVFQAIKEYVQEN